MQAELDHLLHSMTDVRENVTDGVTLYTGTLGSHSVAAMQCGVAWIVAFIVRLAGMALGLG